MTTSNYMPDVVVEIAWTSDYDTPAASRTWTDVSDYVELGEGITITGGRQDERGTADANSLSLTLDNRDGRFTFGNTASPYHPNVKIGRPIRVRATRPGGSSSTRFVGYIDTWPVEWPGSDATAYARITATSRLARLGRSAPLGNAIAAKYLADSPWGYWMLNGRNEATDRRGKLGFAGDGDKPTFEDPGPYYDGTTAAQFSQGRSLFKNAGALPAGDCTVEIGVQVEGDERGTLFAFFTGTDPAADSTYYAQVRPVGTIRFGRSTTSTGAWSRDSTATVDDGLWHHVAVVYDGFSTLLYIDGVLDTTATGETFALGSKFAIGGDAGDYNPNYDDRTLTGALSHFAINSAALPAARIDAHADILTAGQGSQSAHDRLDLYASLAGIPAAETDFATGGATIAAAEVGSETPLDLMRIVEAADMGVLHDAPDGTLTYDGFGSRAAASVGVTLSMAAQEVEANLAATVDRSTLVNAAVVKQRGGDLVATSEDATSMAAYGPHRLEVEVALTTLTALRDLANYLVATYAEPGVRIPSLAVQVTSLDSTALVDAVMAAGVSTKVRVTGWPSQAAASTYDFFIEGWTEEFAPESHRIEWNVSPA